MSPERQYKRPDIELDQQLALKAAATNLQKRFEGVFGLETIEMFLLTSYDEFADKPDYWLPRGTTWSGLFGASRHSSGD